MCEIYLATISTQAPMHFPHARCHELGAFDELIRLDHQLGLVFCFIIFDL